MTLGNVEWGIVNPKLNTYDGVVEVDPVRCGDNGNKGAVAGPIMEMGTHTFTIIIEKGDSGNFVGAGVYLGLADATAHITEAAGGDAWRSKMLMSEKSSFKMTR